MGTVERASESFGPFFTERSLTVGTRRMSVGAQAQVAHYSRLDSYNLRDGTFVTTANQFRDEARPFDVESLTLELRSTTVTVFGNLGLHDCIDLGLAVPFIRLALEGEPRERLPRQQLGAGKCHRRQRPGSATSPCVASSTCCRAPAAASR